GLVALANTITDYRVLEKLVLSRNQLVCNGFGEKSTAGIEALCGVLAQTPKLSHLVFTDNGLDYLSCTSLATMLAENHVLTALDVSRNPIGDAGAAHIATGVRKNASLTSLNLLACQLCSDAFTELATSLRKFNRKLQTIEVETSPPASGKYDKCVERIREFVQVNAALQSLRSGFKSFEFDSLRNDEQRTNFVEKLRDLSESELQALCEMHVMESARVATHSYSDASNAAMEQHGGGAVSNLRTFATLAKSESLKRLLWVLEAPGRQAHLRERSERLKKPARSASASATRRAGRELGGGETEDDDDDDDVWDYPLC
ncbi:hypothetical protein PybrP1_003177, partial [[Pythium] brassicae (nom. inval.)]